MYTGLKETSIKRRIVLFFVLLSAVSIQQCASDSRESSTDKLNRFKKLHGIKKYDTDNRPQDFMQDAIHKHQGEIFEEFVCRFYSDSAFQVSRIIFPLPGKALTAKNQSPNSAYSDTLLFESDWEFVSIRTIKRLYPLSAIEVSRESAIDYHFQEDDSIGVKFLFVKQEGDWHLHRLISP